MYNPRHFVNRQPQVAAFESRLQGQTRSNVLLFHGPLGMGKTTMLYRLREVCRKLAIQSALVDFQGEGVFQPEAVIDKLRNELRGDFFEAISKEIALLEVDFPRSSPQARALAALTSVEPLAGSIGSSTGGLPSRPPAASQIEGQIGSLGPDAQAAIGQNIIQNRVTINNPIFAAPGQEFSLVEKERLQRLSHVMRNALEVLTAAGPLVLLFDACDNAAEGIIPWLREHILNPVLDGSFASADNLAIVLVGDTHSQKGAWLREIMDWGEGVAVHPLDNLPSDAVRQYWIEIRGLAPANLPSVFVNGAPPYLLVQMANFTQGISGFQP
jgi:DNA polymerase III delta prime subunit